MYFKYMLFIDVTDQYISTLTFIVCQAWRITIIIIWRTTCAWCNIGVVYVPANLLSIFLAFMGGHDWSAVFHITCNT